MAKWIGVLLLVGSCAVDPTVDSLSTEATVGAIPHTSVWKYWDNGGDLGTDWRGLAFDDSAWASGAGPLGYGESYVSTVISYGPSASDKYITSYFRRTFNVDDPAAVTAISGEMMFDDGVVVYINGTRIGRDAMPSGDYDASTLAFGHEIGNAYQPYTWTQHKSLLVAGANVMAVEVHQHGSSSSDLTFDLSLTIESDETEEPEDPPPLNHGGIERTAFWTYWDQGGDQGTAWRTTPFETLLSLGWESDRGSFGYGETYHRTTVSYGPDASNKDITIYFRNEFYVDNPSAVNSMIGSVMYDDGYVVYLNGFEIGRTSMPSGSIDASTEAIGHETGNNYETVDWSADLDRLVPGRNEIAVEVHQSSPSSSDLSFDLGLELDGDETHEPPPPPSEEGIARGAAWTYWDQGGSLGTAWTQIGFDASSWWTGAGPLGYGEPYLATTIGYGPDAGSKYITTYFRKQFTVADPAAVTALLGEVMYDDGIVVYLNGNRIGDSSMPSGTTTATTYALGHEASGYQSYDWTAQLPYLVAGTNVIAIEVHQASASSSDLVFDVSLTVETGDEPPPPPPAVEDIPRRAVWSYWDGTQAPSASDFWADPDYDDTAWTRGAGPLGYGESYVATPISYGGDPANKTITAYFRRTFTIADPAAVTAISAELMYDDGVVVHLNGHEISRRHMPSGPIVHTTPSTGHETGNNYESYDWTAQLPYLVAGTNVIAIEVHQAGASSSDLVFDLSLTVDSSCAQPQVASWTGTSGTAEEHGGGDSEDYAEVTWTLASSDGCVDRYTPSGTATYRIGSHVGTDSSPESAPIEPGDGELVIDRSTSPATYTMNGVSEWSGYFCCSDPDDPTSWYPTTLRSRWATDYHGAFELDVFGGGEGSPGQVSYYTHWAFTAAGASFPPPVAGACSEPASDRWDTVTTNSNDTATITWTRDSTTGCVDRYTPSGTMVVAPFLGGSLCQELRWEPASGPVAPEDGRLVIDRSVNPPTFWIEGSTSWVATSTCTQPDGSVETADGVFAGGTWAEDWNGPFHGDEFAGGFGTFGTGSGRDWSFARW